MVGETMAIETSPRARQVIDRLLVAHEDSFDVERDHLFAGRVFPGYAAFHAEMSQYVLVRRAKLWQVDTDEHILFAAAPYLDEAGVDAWMAFMATDAIAKVHLTPEHMTTYLTLVIVADAVAPAAAEAVRRAHYRKNFSWGWRGWADVRLAVVDLGRGTVVTNNQGKPLAATLRANALDIGEGVGRGPAASGRAISRGSEGSPDRRRPRFRRTCRDKERKES